MANIHLSATDLGLTPKPAAQSTPTPQQPVTPVAQPPDISGQDPNVLALQNAIRKQESGGNYKAVSRDGGNGAYQWKQGTWQSEAGKYLGNPNAQLTPENQDKVAYSRIKELKDQGKTPDQIAAIWNHGTDENYGNIVGINSAGVSYNTPQYVKNVMANYQQEVANLKSSKTLGLPAGSVSTQPQNVGTTLPSAPGEDQPQGLGSQIAKGSADSIHAGYGAFSNALDRTGVPQLVGGLVGGAGGLIGGTVGAIGTPISNAIQGKPLFQNLGKNIKETAASTAKFGYGEGKAGVPAAIAGEFGGFIPNLALAYGQGYEGVKDIKQGIQEKDAAKGLQGVLELGTSVFGGVEAGEEIAGNKNLFLSDTSKNILAGDKEAAIKKATEKATATYRDVLRPTKGEVKNIDIKQGRDINKLYQTMAEEGIPVGKSIDKKLDTSEGLDAMGEKIDEQENKLQAELAKQPNVSHSLFDLADRAKEKVSKMEKPALEKETMKTNLDKIVQAEIADQFGADWKAKGKVPTVDNTRYNQIKRNMWQMGYDQGNPTMKPSAKLLGNIIKEDIVDRNPDQAIQDINDKYSEYLGIKSLLENAHGRVIKGGIMGKAFAGMAGAIAGEAIPIPVAGPLIGKYLGEKVFEKMSDPTSLTQGAANKIKKAQNIPKPFFSPK